MRPIFHYGKGLIALSHTFKTNPDELVPVKAARTGWEEYGTAPALFHLAFFVVGEKFVQTRHFRFVFALYAKQPQLFESFFAHKQT